MPLNPFQATCARPPKGAIRWWLLSRAITPLRRPSVGWVTRSLPTDFECNVRGQSLRRSRWKMLCSFPLYEALPTGELSDAAERPFRRPNGIRAEGCERHGCRERRKGPWMALVRRSPERGWNEGSLAKRDPDAGAKRFWLLFRRLEKVTRPAGRNHCFDPLGKPTRWRRQNFCEQKTVSHRRHGFGRRQCQLTHSPPPWSR